MALAVEYERSVPVDQVTTSTLPLPRHSLEVVGYDPDRPGSM